MSTEDEKIEQYLKDPMSMPEGAELAALLGGEEAPEGQPNAQPSPEPELKEGEKAAGAAPGTTDKPKDDPNPAGGELEKPEVEDPDKTIVKSKDNKHEIPYTVLQETRERAVRAESMVRELNEKLAQQAHAKETGQPDKSADLEDIVDEAMLAELREESPHVADVIDKLIGHAKSLETAVSKVAPLAEQNERETEIQQQITVEEAITAVPKLVHIRTNDPATFNEVVGFDQALRAQPKWQGKPLQERFEAAVRMYEAANGPIELPGAQPATKPDEGATAQKVAAAVAKAEAAATGPNTLSDIPGGIAAASNDQDALTSLTSTALTDRFMHMSPEQIEAELARLS